MGRGVWCATSGMARGSMLSGVSVVYRVTSHFATRLNAEVSEMPRMFAMEAYYFATQMALCGKGSRGRLSTLFFMMLYKVFFMLDGTED